MKALKIIFILIAVLIIVVTIALFVFLKTVDIDQYKTKITQYVSEALNREVRIEDIDFDLSLQHGLTLNIKNLAIEDDPSFNQEALFSVQSIYLHVDAVTLITQRRLLVSKIIFNSPKVFVIRNEHGETNLQRLSERRPVGQAKPSEPKGGSAKEQ